MIQLFLGLVAIGAILGLIFSRRGEEGEGALRGAKKGAIFGCGCISVLCLILLAIVLLFFFSFFSTM